LKSDKNSFKRGIINDKATFVEKKLWKIHTML